MWTEHSFFTPGFNGAKTNKMNCYRWILPVSIIKMVVLLMMPFEPIRDNQILLAGSIGQ